MSKIFIPAANEYREIDQIVAFGCSMTQGDELLDHQRYPNVNPEDYKLRHGIMNWYAYKNQNPLPMEIARDINYQEGQLAWPTQLARKYGIPCINLAESGTSFEKQIFQFYKAVNENQITKNTLVVWGLTTKERGILFVNNKVQEYLLSGIIEPDAVKESNDVSQFWYMTMHSEIMLMWKYYLCLNTVFKVAQEILNDQLIIIQSLPTNIDITQLNDNNIDPYIISAFSAMYEDYIKSYNKYSLFEINSKYNIFSDYAKNFGKILGGGHPNVHTHVKYASLIYETINKKASYFSSHYGS